MDNAAIMAQWGVAPLAQVGHGRNVVTLEDSKGNLRLYRVKLADRQTVVDTTRRLRNAMDAQGCAIRGWTQDGDSYKVVAEVRQQA